MTSATPDQQWWYLDGGATKGPAASDEIRSLVERGQLNTQSQVIAVGSQVWGTVGEHFPDLVRPAAAPPPPPPPPAPSSPPPSSPPPPSPTPSFAQPDAATTTQQQPGVAAASSLSLSRDQIVGWMAVGAAVLTLLALLFDVEFPDSGGESFQGIEDPGLLLSGLALAALLGFAAFLLLARKQTVLGLSLALGAGVMVLGGALGSTFSLLAGDLEGAGAILGWLSALAVVAVGVMAALALRPHGLLQRRQLTPTVRLRSGILLGLACVVALTYALDFLSFESAGADSPVAEESSEGFSPLQDADADVVGTIVEMAAVALVPALAVWLVDRRLRTGLLVAWLVYVLAGVLTLLLWTATDRFAGIDFAEFGAEIKLEIGGILYVLAAVATAGCIVAWNWLKPGANDEPGTGQGTAVTTNP